MSSAPTGMHSPLAARAAEELGLRLGPANLDVFAEVLLELARADSHIVAVTSDSRGSGKLGPFGRALPRQIVEVGIAEQNLVGMAAGLAASGHRVFAVSPACFLTTRALEQIKNDVAYSDHPVVLVGISAGVSYGALGGTHHSLHDFAALRAIPNLTITAPADAAETRAAIKAVLASGKPAYLRFGKAPLFDLPCLPEGKSTVSGDPVASLGGSARLIREGSDAALIATGETVIHALLAAEHLHRTEGWSCRVLSMPTIRPLDRASVVAAARECRAVVTVEEHSIHGGLGEACAAVVAQARIAVPFRIMGVPDEDTVTGTQADIFRHYGLTLEGLAQAVRELIRG